MFCFRILRKRLVITKVDYIQESYFFCSDIIFLRGADISNTNLHFLKLLYSSQILIISLKRNVIAKKKLNCI